MSVDKFYFDGVNLFTNKVCFQLCVMKRNKRGHCYNIQIQELQKDLIEDAFNQLKAAVVYDRELSDEFNNDNE